MFKYLVLSSVLCLLVFNGAFAQSAKKYSGSSSKGSSAKGSTSKADKEHFKKIEREMRKEFASVKLDRNQRSVMKRLLEENFTKIKGFDQQIARTIPADQLRSLQKAFRVAEKEGNSRIEAMKISMKAIAMDDDMQAKVLKQNMGKEEVLDSIRTQMSETFTEDQAAAYDKMVMAKKEAMGEEEGSEAKKEEGSEMKKEEMAKEEMAKKEGSEMKKEDGSAAKKEEGSEMKKEEMGKEAGSAAKEAVTESAGSTNK